MVASNNFHCGIEVFNASWSEDDSPPGPTQLSEELAIPWWAEGDETGWKIDKMENTLDTR